MKLDTGSKWAKFSRKSQGKTFVKYIVIQSGSYLVDGLQIMPLI